MRSWSLAFLCGVLLLQQFTFLPAQYWLIITGAAAFLIEFFLVKKYFYLRYLAAVLFGFFWGLWYVHALFSWNLPVDLEGKPILIKGYISSIPSISDNRATFLFSLKTIQDHPAHAIIKLSSQNILENLRAGDKWQWQVKLKRIHGLMNPGGFDYESFALQAGIRANGYVLKSSNNRLLESHWYHDFFNRLRQKLKNKIEMILPKSDTSPWIIALALGERENISEDKWEVLRNTGTNHLMAIAGLHIGFMASFIFFVTSFFWRQIPKLTLMIPAQFAGGFFALAMAILYSALAGFSIPTQRACFMLSAALIMLVTRRTILSWQGWCIALLAVLIVNPLCVLTTSFWLSFISVALIIYGVSGRLHEKNVWWKSGRVQFVIVLGLIPLSIGLFQQFSLVSFLANSIAIPWVGFVIVPLTLFGCFILIFSVKAGGFILLLADKLLAILWKILSWFSHLSWASWYIMIPDTGVLLLACVGMIIILLPKGFSGKFFGIFWLFPLIFYHYPAPQKGNVWFTLLDVGQGLSAVLQTKNHILVFDAGGKFGANYDMGESVVSPFLRSIGAKKIDMLVVSHPDNDHLGGAKTLFHYFPILNARSSTPDRLLPFSSQYCLRGESWQWDNVNFKFLYPPPENLNLDNNSSCVLLITDQAHHHILLTGDIEKFAEKYLTEHDGKNLSADIIVAPHHGSKTSAMSEFVDDINPRYVLFPVGYLNRYHFPHASVVKKYQQINANLLETDKSGAVQIKFSKDTLLLSEYRRDHYRYWNFTDGLE
ncbi:MAG TPA: DNA internalization-related competence protein ComEC/Rec2 [Gammaproteobacteria bacterium]|nr:DNA internalization-related competence protein ComEC/Rec2 [Gammaproteobacteria bacterium]